MGGGNRWLSLFLEEGLVEGEVLAGDGGEGVGVADAGLGGVGEAAGEGGIDQEAVEGGGEVIGVGRGGEQAGLFMGDQVDQAGDAADDDGDAGGHGLEGGKAEALPLAGQDEEVGGF